MALKYLMCVAGGAAIGYYVAKERLEQQFFARLQEETEEAQDFYRRKYEKLLDEHLTVAEEDELSSEAAAEALEAYKGMTTAPSVMTQELAAVVKREAAEEASELSSRSSSAIDTMSEPGAEEILAKAILNDEPKQPVAYHEISSPPRNEKKIPASREDDSILIITSEEFIKNETGYAQYSITYFSGDDILAGEHDQVLKLEARNASMSEDVLLQLKAGPEAMGGASFIYTRNPDDQTEFEIEWKSGTYTDLIGPIERTG